MVRIAKLAWHLFGFRSKNRLKRYDRDGFLEFGLFPIKSVPGQSIYYYPPAYLFQLIPENNTPYTTRSVQKNQIPFFKRKTNFFRNSLFLAVMLEWDKLDVNIRNSASCNVFKRVILKLIRPEPDQVFNVDSSEKL